MRYLQIVILVLIPIIIYSQDGFREGFVAKNDGTILKGQLKYRLNDASYESCLFKNENGEIVEYYPGNIASYGYTDGKFYTSQVVNGAFVEVLVEAQVSLYKLKKNYYVSKGEELLELNSNKQIVTENGKRIEKDASNWIGKLSYLISDCMKLPERTSFRDKILTSVIVQYNSCKGYSYKLYEEKMKWTKTDFFVEAGISSTKLSPSKSSLPQYEYLKSKHTSINPFIGVLIEISFPRMNGKSSALISSQLSNQRFIGFTQIRENSQIKYFDTSFEITTFSLPIAYKYTYPTNAGNFFLTAGGNLDYNLRYKSIVIYEVVIDNTVYSDEYRGFDINKFQYGVWGSIGFSKSIKSRTVGVMLKHFHMLNMSSSAQLDLNNTRSSFSLFFTI